MTESLPPDSVNKWEFRKNEHSRMIKQFLKFSKRSPDEVILMDTESRFKLLRDYAHSLWGVNAENTVILKIDRLMLFFEVNGIYITEYEDDLYPPDY